jgi:exonuclease VII large subunit
MNKELEAKQSKLSELSKVIQIHNRQTLTSLEKQEVDNLEGRLQFRLMELLNECKERELDLKIEVYGQVVDVINRTKK